MSKADSRTIADVLDIDIDASDAFYTFDDEQGNIFTDDDRMIFIEAYTQGLEAMRNKVLDILGE